MWRIHVDDQTIESDDFLIEDLESIEAATGVPWSISNPLKEIKTAKAFLAVAMLRLGRTDHEVAEELKTLTLKKLKVAFDYVPDEDDDRPVGKAPADHLAKSGRASRSGPRKKAGVPPSSSENVLETSFAS